MERYRVIQELRRAMMLLREEKVGSLIPEVSSNLGYALPYAEGPEDVAAFPGGSSDWENRSCQSVIRSRCLPAYRQHHPDGNEVPSGVLFGDEHPYQG